MPPFLLPPTPQFYRPSFCLWATGCAHITCLHLQPRFSALPSGKAPPTSAPSHQAILSSCLCRLSSAQTTLSSSLWWPLFVPPPRPHCPYLSPPLAGICCPLFLLVLRRLAYLGTQVPALVGCVHLVGKAPHPSGDLLRVLRLPYTLSPPLVSHGGLWPQEKGGAWHPSECSRKNFSDLGAKGPGGHLQVPASPPRSLPYPRASGCLSEGDGNRGEETPGHSCLLSLKASPWGQFIWSLFNIPGTH